MEKNNISKKGRSETLDFRRHKHTNSPVFSTIILAVIMLLVVSETILLNMSLDSSYFTASPTSEVLQMMRTEKKSLALPKNRMEGKSLALPKNRMEGKSLALPKNRVERKTLAPPKSKMEKKSLAPPKSKMEKKSLVSPKNRMERKALASAKNRMKMKSLRLQKNKMERKSLESPKNSIIRERIAWLCSHLQEFELFKSTNLSKKFHQRVLKSLEEKCEISFFMTWFSPAEFFGKRELLAVESLFKAHPQGCLMIVSQSMDSLQGHNILKPLLDRGYKVSAATPDISLLLKNTPAESWFQEMKSCKRDPGTIPLSQNLSNLARLAILYKYGGVYLDTDFIVTRSFKGLRNSIGAQEVVEGGDSKNWTMLNNAVLIFKKDHPLLHHFMEEFASTFNGNKWGGNGPYLVTRVVQRVQETIGNSFTVLPQVAFYPFNWIDIRRLFQTPRSSNDSTLLKADLIKLNRESYGLHLWNKNTRKLRIEKGSVIDIIISDKCVVCKGIQR